MSDNANQPISRTGSENSGDGGHFDQSGRRSNPSGNRNNRRRRPSQQIGGEQSANHSQRQAVTNPGAPARQNVQSAGTQPGTQSGTQPGAQSGTQQGLQAGKQPQNQSARQDPYQQRRSNNRPQRPNQPADARSTTPAGKTSSVNIPQNPARSTEKPEQINERQIPAARSEKTENQAFGSRKNNANPAPRTERPREPRTWARNIRTEETHEDIHKENERLEKEIWLEIASIHTYKLD